MNRKELVKQVHEFVNAYGVDENSFELLHAKLLEEIELERKFVNIFRSKRYLNNLRSIKGQEAVEYSKARKSNTGAAAAFSNFVSAFSNVTRWAK